MSPDDVAAWIIFGPLILAWWAFMLKGTYNILRHNSFFGE